MNWAFFIEVLVGGLLAGVMYSLVALGFVLIYKASGVFNFAQGAMVFFAALTFVSLVERGVNFWLALVITLMVMVVLGIAIERMVLRPLVNQPQITLFMATIGLTFVLEGVSQLVWGSQPHGLELGIPDVPMQWLADRTNINISQFDLFAAAVAGILVAALAIFFQTTRHRPRLRAVADDHQAALAVGIPLRQIWAIVWTVAGFVALVAGLMWGARNGVQYALTFIALKALPVLISAASSRSPAPSSAGSSSAPRKNWPKSISGHWSAAVSSPGSPTYWRSRSCSCVPRGCSAKNGSSGSRRCLSRSRSVQDDVRVRSAGLSDSAGPDRRWAHIAIAFAVVPLVANQYWLSAILTPFLIFALATLGLNILTGYAGQLSARRRRVHGGRRVHDL
jgi:branched-chain amino acid transport system permease protein